jgi:hypothetical protein
LQAQRLLQQNHANSGHPLIFDCYRSSRNSVQQGALLFLTMHLNPTWLAEVSMGSA